jgi:hypothetical protein
MGRGIRPVFYDHFIRHIPPVYAEIGGVRPFPSR